MPTKPTTKSPSLFSHLHSVLSLAKVNRSPRPSQKQLQGRIIVLGKKESPNQLHKILNTKLTHWQTSQYQNPSTTVVKLDMSSGPTWLIKLWAPQPSLPPSAPTPLDINDKLTTPQPETHWALHTALPSVSHWIP